MNIYLQRVQDAIAEAVAGMDVAQLTRHPEGKWSAAEIIEHLDRTYKGTASLAQKCLDGGAPTASRGTLAQRVAVAVVVELGYMPSGREAPPFAVPKGLPAEQVLRAVPEHIAQLDRALEECERRFGARRRLADHFILGPLSADQWRKFHWVHTRHHLKQIARLRGG